VGGTWVGDKRKLRRASMYFPRSTQADYETFISTPQSLPDKGG